MPTIETIIRQANKDLVPQFEERLRSILVTQDKQWLIDQIIRLALDAHSLHEMDRKQFQQAKAEARSERLARLQKMRLDPQVLEAFLEPYRSSSRAALNRDGYLVESAPAK